MTAASRWQTFFHALAFVLGFSLVFVAARRVGGVRRLCAERLYLPTIVKIGGIVLILFGLYVVGVFRLAGRPAPRHGRGQERARPRLHCLQSTA